MRVHYNWDGGTHHTIILPLVLLCVIAEHHVTCTENLPKEIMVQCGSEQCNILEQYCTANNVCDKCNEDECKLPRGPGERPPQCFFKCDHVMEKLKNYPDGGSPNWILYMCLLGSYAGLMTLVVFIFISVLAIRTRNIQCCRRRDRPTSSEEQDLVSHHVTESSESPQVPDTSTSSLQEPPRRSPVIASPQNDRECGNMLTSNQQT